MWTVQLGMQGGVYKGRVCPCLSDCQVADTNLAAVLVRAGIRCARAAWLHGICVVRHGWPRVITAVTEKGGLHQPLL